MLWTKNLRTSIRRKMRCDHIIIILLLNDSCSSTWYIHASWNIRLVLCRKNGIGCLKKQRRWWYNVCFMLYSRLNHIHLVMYLPWITVLILCLYIVQLSEKNTMLETVNVALKANLAKKDSDIAKLQSFLKEETDVVSHLNQKLTMVRKYLWYA